MKQPTTYNFSFSFDSITLYGTIFGIVLGAAFAISTSSLLAWNAPSATPPNGNVSGSPITTGAAQTKAGSLTLGTGASMTAPRYCIGSSCITAWPAGGAGEEADTLATVAARGNRTTGFIQADEMRACGGGSCSYLRNAGNNYLRGNTFFNGVLYDENNTDYYLDPSHWSRVNRLRVSGDSVFGWPNDNDDAATVAWVNARVGVSVVAGCGSDTYYNCAGCWAGATCGSWGSAMRCPAGSWRIPIQYNGLCVR